MDKVVMKLVPYSTPEGTKPCVLCGCGIGECSNNNPDPLAKLGDSLDGCCPACDAGVSLARRIQRSKWCKHDENQGFQVVRWTLREIGERHRFRVQYAKSRRQDGVSAEELLRRVMDRDQPSYNPHFAELWHAIMD